MTVSRFPLLLLILSLLPPAALDARVFFSANEVLEETFPGAKIERLRLRLTRNEQDRLIDSTGSRDEGRLYTLYLARKGDQVVGMGLFDTRIVRTKGQTLFVALSPSGKVQRISVVSFFEPLEYLVPARWLALWRGRDRGRPNIPGKDLPGISGATLSTAAVSQTVRKTFYLFSLYSSEHKVAGK